MDFSNNFIQMEKKVAHNKTIESQESSKSLSSTKRASLSLSKKANTPKNKCQKNFQKMLENEKILKFRKEK